jgi:hypothetical protein
VDLLPELRLSLLDSGHDHVADTASRQSVQTGTNTLDGDDVEVSGARVVCAVHDSAAVVPPLAPCFQNTPSRVYEAANRGGCAPAEFRIDVHRQTEGHLELATRGTTPKRLYVSNLLLTVARSPSVLFP